MHMHSTLPYFQLCCETGILLYLAEVLVLCCCSVVIEDLRTVRLMNWPRTWWACAFNARLDRSGLHLMYLYPYIFLVQDFSQPRTSVVELSRTTAKKCPELPLSLATKCSMTVGMSKSLAVLLRMHACIRHTASLSSTVVSGEK